MSVGTPDVAATRSLRGPLAPISYIRAGIVVALMLAVYWGPIRNLLIQRWIDDGNWSHGWLIPLFSLYFLSTRREELARCRIRPAFSGAVILAAGLAMYAYAVQKGFGYPQALSLIVSIFGVTALLAGTQVMRIAWFPILFLTFAVPLPRTYYVELTRPLRELASTVAASLLPILVPGLHTQAQAVVIDYIAPGGTTGQLNVEEACSGMRLMMAFVTLGVAMAYLNERPWWHRVVLLISCIPIAVLCNAVRVTTTGLLVIKGHGDLAQGTPHQLLGLGMLLLAFGLYALIAYILNHLFVEVEDAA